MHNNKNRMRDREKSNAELRKMDPRDNSDAGMIKTQLTGAVNTGKNDKARTKKDQRQDES